MELCGEQANEGEAVVGLAREGNSRWRRIIGDQIFGHGSCLCRCESKTVSHDLRCHL